MSHRRPLLGVVLALAALPTALGLVLIGGGTAWAGDPTGAPRSADVHFQALVGIPPQSYGMVCTTQPDCHETGNIDLATEADVGVALDPRTGTVHGAASLSYTKAEGSVGMNWACEGEPGRWVSEQHPTGTTSGELEVVDLQSDPRTNSLSVVIDPAGRSGTDFPLEDVRRTDGGCGSDDQVIKQQQGLWYYNFHLAHQAEWQDGGNARITGLTWKDGVYSRTFERFVTVGFPPFTHLVYESTTIQVVPEYCAGDQNQIRTAAADGTSLGLDGMHFFPGQRITVPSETRIDLADGSTIKLEKGGSFTVDSCETNETVLRVNGTVKSLWVHFKKIVAGSNRKFDVKTERAVAGVRGTIFKLSYDKATKLTKVLVTEHQVSLKRLGARRGVMIQEGQVGVQKGSKAPRIVRR